MFILFDYQLFLSIAIGLFSTLVGHVMWTIFDCARRWINGPADTVGMLECAPSEDVPDNLVEPVSDTETGGRESEHSFEQPSPTESSVRAVIDYESPICHERPETVDSSDTIFVDSTYTRHYLKLEQIWSDSEKSWVPYDPQVCHIQTAPVELDPDHYFVVNLRHKVPEDKPELVLSFFSEPLIHFLRALIGDRFFCPNPEQNITRLFHDISQFKAAVDAARSYLISGEVTLQEKVDCARRTGAPEKWVNEDCVDNWLYDVVEQAGALIEYLEEELSAAEEHMNLLKSYGRIDYESLIYLVQPGDKLTMITADGEAAFVLDEKGYKESSFYTKGSAYKWDGMEYASYSIERIIGAFDGTIELSSLPFKHLLPMHEAALNSRGRRYASLSGVHLRCYFGDRVIIDRKAYDNRRGYVRPSNVVVPHIHEDKLSLLPPVVYGFNLTSKTWSGFCVDHLQPVRFDEDAWDHLVLEPGTKNLVESLVGVFNNANSTSLLSDVISGKNGGLIAVLYGPPGTGKSLTSEAVAEHLKRPLHTLSSAELASYPSSFEQTLKTALSLANAWDAVLLIDDADLFLEPRNALEIRRNAYICAALRMLEYHRGVVFLTTNRIATFDEALLSRFSLVIKYPELDQSARRLIWSKFFDLAGSPVERAGSRPSSMVGRTNRDCLIRERRYISSTDLEMLSEKQLDGRSIKNIVRMAQALAMAQGEPLSIGHVKSALAARVFAAQVNI